ncbi:MAG: hypothetical protein IPN25_11765 [Sphingobacteriales bacterium]|nr:hypothetical protein [Sphingobacteriales bacterium]
MLKPPRKENLLWGGFSAFKLHLIVNHKGQIVDFALTTGQVADNSKDLLNKLLEKISGTLFD